MKNILVIESSPRNDLSISKKLTQEVLMKLKTIYTDVEISIEDIALNPPPHLTLSQIDAFFTQENQRSGDQKSVIKISDRYIEQLKKTDIIIISFPVWNFCIPSSLKAWIDQIVRVGQTFQYVEGFPKGLLQDKSVYLVLARGGVYKDSIHIEDKDYFDFSILYLKNILRYIGLDKVIPIVAEGLAIPHQHESALKKAIESIDVNVF